jgi:hypothetical protein
MEEHISALEPVSDTPRSTDLEAVIAVLITASTVNGLDGIVTPFDDPKKSTYMIDGYGETPSAN